MPRFIEITNKEQGMLNSEVRQIQRSAFLVPYSIFETVMGTGQVQDLTPGANDALGALYNLLQAILDRARLRFGILVQPFQHLYL